MSLAYIQKLHPECRIIVPKDDPVPFCPLTKKEKELQYDLASYKGKPSFKVDRLKPGVYLALISFRKNNPYYSYLIDNRENKARVLTHSSITSTHGTDLGDAGERPTYLKGYVQGKILRKLK
jgi:hypothetical protein